MTLLHLPLIPALPQLRRLPSVGLFSQSPIPGYFQHSGDGSTLPPFKWPSHTHTPRVKPIGPTRESESPPHLAMFLHPASRASTRHPSSFSPVNMVICVLTEETQKQRVAGVGGRNKGQVGPLLAIISWIPLLVADVTMRCWGRTSGVAAAEVEGRSGGKLGRSRVEAVTIKLKCCKAKWKKKKQ